MQALTPEVHPSLPNILVVDDTPEILQLLTLMLKKHGYRVRSVLSGKLAIQAVLNEQPDLILLDIDIPEMDGFEVCEHLKANESWKDIPILFISGLDETTDKVKAFALGGVDYVTKPFQFEEIHARVETHLRIRFLQRQLREQNENLERLVADRTRELAKAYERLRELDKIKDDFLRMISHEIRTPANGILGIGNLILDLCPVSEDHILYADLFAQSSLRLRNLIEDAALITDIETLTQMNGDSISFPDLLAKVRTSLPDILISLEESAVPETFFLKGYPPLLKRAMESLILLAASFSLNRHAVRVTKVVEERGLRVYLAVDALTLSSEQVDTFFEIESSVRSASSAEWMGLAPVVAHQIISVLGGEIKLVKKEGSDGYLEMLLLKEHLPSDTL